MKKLVFALKITDAPKYLAYRNMIRPLMDKLGIVILKEFRISEVVHSDEESENVNMVAMFGFPSEQVKVEFFGSPTYQQAKLLFNESTANFSKLME